MSLLFNKLSTLIITFLSRSKCLLISWFQSSPAVIFEPPKIKSATVSAISPSIYHKVMRPWSSFSECWALSQYLLLPCHYIYHLNFVSHFPLYPTTYLSIYPKPSLYFLALICLFSPIWQCFHLICPFSFLICLNIFIYQTNCSGPFVFTIVFPYVILIIFCM